MPKNKVAILGAGSWGTAVAIHIANNNVPVYLWGHNPQHIDQLISTRENKKYLPNIAFPKNVIPTNDLSICLEQASLVIIAVPSDAFIEIFEQVFTHVNQIAWLTKGLAKNETLFFSNYIFDKLGNNFPAAIISGPSFAKEVAQGLPTALTIASNNPELQILAHSYLHHHNLRAYFSNDLIGVQICGTVKNILAIACGVSDGLNYGSNAKAALITRGLSEMKQLGVSLNAKEETFMGLTGIGDLVLTCMDNQSRNRRFGLALGKGLDLDTAEKSIGQVVEGRHNAAIIHHLAQKISVDMPICNEVYRLLKGELSPIQAAKNLLERTPKYE